MRCRYQRGRAFPILSNYSSWVNHWVPAVILLLVATGLPRASIAQARVGQSTGQRTGTARTQQPSPSPSSANRPTDRSPSQRGGFTSGLMFVPPPSDAHQGRFPIYAGLAWGSLGFDSLWPWYTMAPSGIYQRALPPREGTPMGGLQLDVDPRRAQVYVDGSYVGLVDEFSGYYHHLDVPAGLHLIEIFESGYQPLIFEIVVPPGRTTTYRGWLTRVPGR